VAAAAATALTATTASTASTDADADADDTDTGGGGEADKPRHEAAPVRAVGAEARLSTPAPAQAGREPRNRRWIFVSAAAVVVAGAAATTALLLTNHDHGGTATPPASTQQGSAHQFMATSPWRLLIRDTAQGNDPGCNVTVTAAGNGVPVAEPTGVYSSVAFQVRASGTFSWTANDPRCVVLHQDGAGMTALPFIPPIRGDSDAFAVHGPVTVRVLDFDGNSVCEFALHDAADGRQVDVGSVPEGGGPVTLDPAGSTQVYLTNWYCQVRLGEK